VLSGIPGFSIIEPVVLTIGVSHLIECR